MDDCINQDTCENVEKKIFSLRKEKGPTRYNIRKEKSCLIQAYSINKKHMIRTQNRNKKIIMTLQTEERTLEDEMYLLCKFWSLHLCM